jgi:hypothetical protein
MEIAAEASPEIRTTITASSPEEGGMKTEAEQSLREMPS